MAMTATNRKAGITPAVALAVLAMALSSMAGTASAAPSSGTSGDGTLGWTTLTNGIATAPGGNTTPNLNVMTIKTGTQTGANGQTGITTQGDTISEYAPSAGGYSLGGTNGNYVPYLPNGAQSSVGTIWSDTHDSNGGYINIAMAAPRTYFGALLNAFAGTDTITFSRAGTAVLTLNMATIGTKLPGAYVTGGSGPNDVYSEYLNVSTNGGAGFDNVKISYGPLVQGYFNLVSISNVAYSSAGYVATAGTADVPEPPATAVLTGLLVAAAATTMATRRRKGL